MDATAQAVAETQVGQAHVLSAGVFEGLGDVNRGGSTSPEAATT
jgi:hypothetical protein